MDRTRKHFLIGALAGALATLVLMLVAGIVIAYSGAYDVSASGGHSSGARWLLDTTMHASVRSRAADADDEQRLRNADVDAGAGEYKAMCEHCHGGPGVEPAAWSRGMLPRPPHMVEAAGEWDGAEVVWIIRHGIKYTGMPAFGEDHSGDALWNIAAFVKQLPAMTPAEYREQGTAAGSAHGAHDRNRSGDHDHRTGESP